MFFSSSTAAILFLFYSIWVKGLPISGRPTTKPTKSFTSTAAPSKKSDAPTKASTLIPTSKSTAGPSKKISNTPTNKPSKSTSAPTTAPSLKSTKAQTTSPSFSHPSIAPSPQPTSNNNVPVTWVIGPYLQSCSQICALGGAKCIAGVNYGKNDLQGLNTVLSGAIDYSLGNCALFQGACYSAFQESVYYTSYYIPGILNGFCAVGKPVDCNAYQVQKISLYSNVCSCTTDFGC